MVQKCRKFKAISQVILASRHRLLARAGGNWGALEKRWSSGGAGVSIGKAGSIRSEGVTPYFPCLHAFVLINYGSHEECCLWWREAHK